MKIYQFALVFGAAAPTVRAGCSLNDNGVASEDNPSWHPTYSAGWTNGYCRLTKDCNSPSFSSEVACCKGAYAGQVSGYCLSQLPSPPTMAPTDLSDLKWYPDYATAWTDAGCFTGRPAALWGGNEGDRPAYDSQAACCKGAYGGQMSGACLSQLPSPPTMAPTELSDILWYPDYDTSWTDAGCFTGNPKDLWGGLKTDRPGYNSLLACCKGSYAGQTSGACLALLPSPPTMAPTDESDIKWYPAYENQWTNGVCYNGRPKDLWGGNKGDRPSYDSQLACCKGAYSGQVSGACLADLPSPPTGSPTTAGGLDVFYPDYSQQWSSGECINDRPLPSGRPTYSSQESCCKGAYAGQTSAHCMCQVDQCYSCKCPGIGDGTGNGCSLDCSR